MQQPSLPSRWLCSWGSRILALRMLHRRAAAEEVTSGCSRSALPRLDRRQRRGCDGRRRILFQCPLAICEGAHAVGPSEIGVVFFINPLLIVVAQIPAT